MADHPSIEIVWEDECPNVEAARDVVREALRQAGLPEEWQEWNVSDSETPESRRGYGSPTILIDGDDVVDGDPAGASSCRVYRRDDGSYAGVPGVDTVLAALS